MIFYDGKIVKMNNQIINKKFKNKKNNTIQIYITVSYKFHKRQYHLVYKFTISTENNNILYEI